MTHYFTRKEAEALLPALTIVLRKIQQSRLQIQQLEITLAAMRAQARHNGKGLHEKLMLLQHDLLQHMMHLRDAINELQTFDCDLKDPDTGLVDFLSLRNGQEIYLCWHLGEERISYWHHLDAGFAGRQPLEQEL